VFEEKFFRYLSSILFHTRNLSPPQSLNFGFSYLLKSFSSGYGASDSLRPLHCTSPSCIFSSPHLFTSRDRRCSPSLFFRTDSAPCLCPLSPTPLSFLAELVAYLRGTLQPDAMHLLPPSLWYSFFFFSFTTALAASEPPPGANIVLRTLEKPPSLPNTPFPFPFGPLVVWTTSLATVSFFSANPPSLFLLVDSVV